jgi:hypothetical protein
MFPELAESGTNPCLDRPQRLMQVSRHFGIRHVGKERSLDRLALVAREEGDGLAQPPRQLLAIDDFVGMLRLGVRERLFGIRIHALVALLVPQAVDRPGPRLVQDPSEHGAVRGVVVLRATPHVVEDVDGQLFGGFTTVGDANDQGERYAVRALIKCAKRGLVAGGNRPDEIDPFLLGDPMPRPIGVK